ncbi:MAG: hypothetical protein AAF919_16965 [Pseudomonadota bacterium]
MTDPATPSQLAANNMAATEEAGADVSPPDSAAIMGLTGLLSEIDALIESYDGLQSTGGIAADWADLHRAHREALSGLLVSLGAQPEPVGVNLVAKGGVTLRATMAGDDAALAALLQRENRLLDRYAEVADALADPDQRATLQAQRAALVDLANRTQDMLDG